LKIKEAESLLSLVFLDHRFSVESLFSRKQNQLSTENQSNTLIIDKRGRPIHASKMLKTMKKGERAEFQRRRRLWKQSVFVAVCRKGRRR
jgi:hypothetical protein